MISADAFYDFPLSDVDRISDKRDLSSSGMGIFQNPKSLKIIMLGTGNLSARND